MRKHARPILWAIIALTIICLLIDLPKSANINFNFKIPILNKVFAINQTFLGFNPQAIGINKDLAFKKGLDLQGGTSITLLADMKGIPSSRQDDALSSAQLVIQRRVDALGVSEPVIQTAQVGSQKRIIVE